MKMKKRQLSGTGLPVRNDILRALLNSEYKHLSPKLEHVHLKRGEIIYQADQRIDHVYFPETAVVAMIDTVEGENLYASAAVGDQSGRLELPGSLRQQFDGLLSDVPGFLSGEPRSSGDRVR